MEDNKPNKETDSQKAQKKQGILLVGGFTLQRFALNKKQTRI